MTDCRWSNSKAEFIELANGEFVFLYGNVEGYGLAYKNATTGMCGTMQGTEFVSDEVLTQMMRPPDPNEFED